MAWRFEAPEAQKSTPGALWDDFGRQKGSPKDPKSDPGSFSGAFLMTLGLENRGKITQNRSKGRSGSENGEFFCKNAEVQQTQCFASPNGSPHDPDSTKTGVWGTRNGVWGSLGDPWRPVELGLAF